MSYLFDCFTIKASLSFLVINLCGSCLRNVWLILSSFFLCDSLVISLILFSFNSCLFFLASVCTLFNVFVINSSCWSYVISIGSSFFFHLLSIVNGVCMGLPYSIISGLCFVVLCGIVRYFNKAVSIQ